MAQLGRAPDVVHLESVGSSPTGYIKIFSFILGLSETFIQQAIKELYESTTIHYCNCTSDLFHCISMANIDHYYFLTCITTLLSPYTANHNIIQ